jgi:hypothetical protein
VTIVTAITSGGYRRPKPRSQRWSPRRAKTPPATRANATCPDGTAAKRLYSTCAESANSRPHNPVRVSVKPAPGTSRGGAVGTIR